MMPMPPSRASAIASRASVTVSIAAETTGMLSSIVRGQPRAGRDVVRQDARLGRHEQHVVEGEAFLGELPVQGDEPLQLVLAEFDAQGMIRVPPSPDGPRAGRLNTCS